MRRTAIAGIVAAGALCAASLLFYLKASERVTPASQQPLAWLKKGDIGPVRDFFNASAGAPRLLMMLSPT